MFNLTAVLETPLGVGGITIESLLYFTLILVIGVLIARIVSINVRRALSDRLAKNERELLTKLVYYGIVILAFLAALPQLNVDLSGFLVAGGIAGIVIGFASQSVISNLISGLFLMFERPIRIGDNINVSNVSGSVEDIRILSTIIKTFDGIYIRIPNEKVFTSNITNYVHNVARRLEYQIGIRYRDDADLAIRSQRCHRDPPVALRNPSPSVFVDSLGENGANLAIRIWAPAREWWDVRTDLLWKIKTAFEANGIRMALPQRTLWFPERLEVEQRSAVEEK